MVRWAVGPIIRRSRRRGKRPLVAAGGEGEEQGEQGEAPHGRVFSQNASRSATRAGAVPPGWDLRATLAGMVA